MKKLPKILLLTTIFLISLTIIGLIIAININQNKLTQQEFNYNQLHVTSSSKILGHLTRQAVETSDEGLERYPIFGTSLSNLTDEEKINLINEANYLKASHNTYDKIDEHGNLYLNDTLLERKLYAHTTSLNTYYGCPLQDEKAVIKEITYQKASGNYITGLYAPAGEVIKISLSQEDLIKTGGVRIQIGQYSQNGELNNIWQARNDFSRMPLLGNELTINTTECYAASFLGGPIYVYPNQETDFTITISGALEYLHFIYGVTTQEEFERLKETSAPYFDLEVSDRCVRHSGPRQYANLDYDNLVKISEFWLATANISRQIPMGSSAKMGITFIYDPFVAAGSAVAFVGRNWCNLPPSWMEGALNYETFTQNGNWGPIHEFNHHYQRYGFNPGDEITNNAISLLSYINNTNISSNRVNTGWNRYLNPETSFKETLDKKVNNDEVNLSCYADIIHAFGVDTFIEAAKYGKGQGGNDKWYESLCEVTGCNMASYFQLLNKTVSDELLSKYSTLKEFIPLTYKYQTGRQIDGKDIITVKPYKISANESVISNLKEDLTLSSDYTYQLLSLSKPQNGKLELEGGTLIYTPLKMEESGNIYMTLEITNLKTKVKQEETLIFNFKPSYLGLNATRYTYDEAKYSSIYEAMKNNFDGYSTKNEEIINKHFVNGIKKNEIYVYEGKFYPEKTGKFNLSIRTSNRSNTLLLAGLTATYGDEIYSEKENPINLNDTFLTYDIKNGDCLYFKIIIQSDHNDGFCELFGGYDDQMKTITTKLYNTNDTKTTYVLNDQYARSYEATSILVPYQKQKVISYTESYSAWDENFQINNILDGNSNTSYHSIKDKMITSEPFALTIDLGDTYYVNELQITGYNGNQMHMPTSFTLYGGTTLNDLKLLDCYEDIAYTGRNLSVSFKGTNIRYYKLVITKTNTNRYIAISDINMALKMSGMIYNPFSFQIQAKPNSIKKITGNYFFGEALRGKGIISLGECANGIGIIASGEVKINLYHNDQKETLTFKDYFFYELTEKENIRIEILNDTPLSAIIK